MQDVPSDPAATPLYRFHAHTTRWQALAVQVRDEPEPEIVVASVRQAIMDAPRDGTMGDRLVARGVLNEILARLVRRAGLERDPDVGGALLALLTTCRSAQWTREALALLEHCAAHAHIIRQTPGSGILVPLLVRRAMTMLEECYCDRFLDESTIAAKWARPRGTFDTNSRSTQGAAFCSIYMRGGSRVPIHASATRRRPSRRSPPPSGTSMPSSFVSTWCVDLECRRARCGRAVRV